MTVALERVLESTAPCNAAAALLDHFVDKESYASFVTSGASGQPHVIHGRAALSPDFRSLVSVTGPKDKEVANVRANPRVEWMFPQANSDHVLYLRGTATVVDVGDPTNLDWQTLSAAERNRLSADLTDPEDFATMVTRLKPYVYYGRNGSITKRIPIKDLKGALLSPNERHLEAC